MSSDDVAKGVAIRAKTKFEDTLADIAAAVEAASKFRALSASSAIAGAARSPSPRPSMSKVSRRLSAITARASRLCREAQLRCPVMLHFGDQDKSIPLADIEKIRREHPDIAIHIYPAGHGFSCNDRSAYDAESAKLARERTLDFFEKNIV